MPVVAVMKGGSPSVRTGSRTAYLGISTKSLRAYFSCVLSSVSTAARVVSLPVPAVVGTVMSRGMGFKIFSSPLMEEIFL